MLPCGYRRVHEHCSCCLRKEQFRLVPRLLGTCRMGRAKIDNQRGGVILRLRVMHSLSSDLRYALRVLRHAPGFSLAVIAVLALGIGANTAVFSIVNAVLLRPMPYENSDRVVRLFHVPPQSAFPGMTRFSVSTANFYDWKASAHS